MSVARTQQIGKEFSSTNIVNDFGIILLCIFTGGMGLCPILRLGQQFTEFSSALCSSTVASVIDLQRFMKFWNKKKIKLSLNSKVC